MAPERAERPSGVTARCAHCMPQAALSERAGTTQLPLTLSALFSEFRDIAISAIPVGLRFAGTSKLLIYKNVMVSVGLIIAEAEAV